MLRIRKQKSRRDEICITVGATVGRTVGIPLSPYATLRFGIRLCTCRPCGTGFSCATDTANPRQRGIPNGMLLSIKKSSCIFVFAHSCFFTRNGLVLKSLFPHKKW
jgi:hypothetical protein